jgi:diguanylate cyclase (GGDEF)-like protein
MKSGIVTFAGKLAFLRGNLVQVSLWPAACGLVAAVLWGVALTRLDEDRALAEHAALANAANLARAYAEHLTSTIAQIDQITMLVKHDWEQGPGRLDLEDLKRRGLFPASELLFVLIANRDGKVMTATSLTRIGATVSDRPYFDFHRYSDTGSLRIGAPIAGRFAGQTVIHFTRRLDGPDGSFGGVVVVSVDPKHFTDFYEGAGLGPAGLIGLIGTDTVLRTARIGEIRRHLAGEVLRETFAPGTREGARFMPGKATFVDGRDRFVAWKTLASHPLVALVALDADEALAVHAQDRADVLKSIMLGTFGLACFAVLAAGLTARLAWRKFQQEQIRDAYRMATEGGSEGFFMLRVIRDRQGRVVDFMVADCNERGAGFLGLTRAELLGERFSGFYPEPYRSALLETFRIALRTGLYEDDMKVPKESPLRVNWVHTKIVRSGSGLALTLRDISDTKAHEQTLSQLANEDPVTGLPNRNWLMRFLPEALERAAQRHGMLGLLFIDLDDFKNVNDTLGHAAGDEVLKGVAGRLRSVLRPTDHVVRIGGDEFTIILEPMSSEADASRVAERIAESFRQPFDLARGRSTLSVSIGIGLFPRDGNDVEALLKCSDIAMYQAKADGKGRHRFYEPGLLEQLKDRLESEQALLRALREDQFIVFYQPRVDAASGCLVGLEALVRWMHPERGLVPPGDFVPLAEETGLVVPMGAAVIEKVCVQLALWREARLPVVPVSINVSSRQFSVGNVADVIGASLEAQGIPPELVEVEITESGMMGDQAEVNASLAALRARGIHLHVDDFGTGYSSLSQLQRLDVDGLKIDRAFTAELGRTREGEVFVKAIISMAHALGMTVTAEGVETTEQLQILQALGCNEIQGFLVSRPVPAARIPAMLQQPLLFDAKVVPLDATA